MSSRNYEIESTTPDPLLTDCEGVETGMYFENGIRERKTIVIIRNNRNETIALFDGVTEIKVTPEDTVKKECEGVYNIKSGVRTEFNIITNGDSNRVNLVVVTNEVKKPKSNFISQLFNL